MIQGKNRRIGESKIWRLTKMARLTLDLSMMKPTSWNEAHVEHHLAITDVWLNLTERGEVSTFNYELREKFNHLGKAHVYAPDILVGFNKRGYLIEIQNTRLSRKRWEAKLKVAEDFFDFNHFHKASWQTKPGKIIRPTIVVISTQPEEVVKQTKLDVRVIKKIDEL